MANNRYYMQCTGCKQYGYLGKSLGFDVYRTPDSEQLAGFMTAHIHCRKGEKQEGEWFGGTHFEVISEYDDEKKLEAGEYDKDNLLQ